MARPRLANDQFSGHQAGPVRKAPKSNRCLPLLPRYNGVLEVRSAGDAALHGQIDYHLGTTFAWLLPPKPNGSLLSHATLHLAPPFSAQTMKDVKQDVPARRATSDTKVLRTMHQEI